MQVEISKTFEKSIFEEKQIMDKHTSIQISKTKQKEIL